MNALRMGLDVAVDTMREVASKYEDNGPSTSGYGVGPPRWTTATHLALTLSLSLSLSLSPTLTLTTDPPHPHHSTFTLSLTLTLTTDHAPAVTAARPRSRVGSTRRAGCRASGATAGGTRWRRPPTAPPTASVRWTARPRARPRWIRATTLRVSPGYYSSEPEPAPIPEPSPSPSPKQLEHGRAVRRALSLTLTR